MTRGHELSLHPASEILGLGTSSLKVFSFLYEKAERAAPAGPVIFTCLSQDITDRAHTGRRERDAKSH